MIHLFNRMRGVVTSSCLVTAAVFAVAGCNKNSEQKLMSFPVSVDVTNDAGVGIPAIPVKFDNAIVGYTNKVGRFRAFVKRPLGSTLEVSVGNMVDYHYLNTPSVSVKLDSYELNGAKVASPIVLAVRATKRKKMVWLWIETECEEDLYPQFCANLPIEIDGNIASYTNAVGVAQVFLEEIPGTELNVRIDTPSASDILERQKEMAVDKVEPYAFQPSDPKYKLVVKDKPNIYSIRVRFYDAFADHKRAERLAKEAEVAKETAEAEKKVAKKSRRRSSSKAKNRDNVNKKGAIRVF